MFAGLGGSTKSLRIFPPESTQADRSGVPPDFAPLINFVTESDATPGKSAAAP